MCAQATREPMGGGMGKFYPHDANQGGRLGLLGAQTLEVRQSFTCDSSFTIRLERAREAEETAEL